jgi:simple sugar transport system permease protein
MIKPICGPLACNEILTTIMLNYIALNWLLYGVHGPLKDPDGFNFPESALFSDFASLEFDLSSPSTLV